MTIAQPPASSGDSPNDISNVIAPLEGEAGIPSVAEARTVKLSRKGIFALVLLVVSLTAVAALSLHRALAPRGNVDGAPRQLGDQPMAAGGDPRRLDLTLAPVQRPASASAATPLIPSINDEPIGVRRTGQTNGLNTGPAAVSPEDAPVLLVSGRPGSPIAPVGGVTAAPTATQGAPTVADDSLDGTKPNLEAYQRQLQEVLDALTRSTDVATGSRGAAMPSGSATSPAAAVVNVIGAATHTVPGAGLFGGQLQGSSTPRVTAATLGNRSLTLPKGTAFTCALKTKIVSAASGLVACQVQRNVFSDDGRVLLIERGSHLDGEYRSASVRPGTVRIPVLWTRLRTPHGVTVDIESPGTGALGESGIDGHLDNRWTERIGAAMLLSLIDDSVKIVVQNQASDRTGDTLVLPSTTESGSKLAEKVLDSTINIPPLIYRDQGSIVGIYVARDVDFSSVYELQAVTR